MNTQFFEKAAGSGKKIRWSDIFSDVFKKHGRDAKSELMLRGIGKNIPSPDRMLRDWQKPWLFARIGLAGLLLSLLVFISCQIFASDGMMLVFCMLPAFVVPFALMIFYWEMNIPGNVSIYEALLMTLLGGILSLTVTGIVRILTEDASNTAFLLGPFPEELAKLVIVYLLLSRKKFSYGLQGILIGGAVGVGFAAIESAGYALSTGLGGGNIALNLLIRGILAIGGHAVWAAVYGGALALAKGKGSLTPRCLCNSLFVMSWTGAFLLHTIWNFSIVYLAAALPEPVVLFFYYMEIWYIKYIILIVLGWLLLMVVMRKSIRQMVRVDAMYQEVSDLEGKHSTAGESRQETEIRRKVAAVVGLNGIYAGQEYPICQDEEVYFGRNRQAVQICFPDGTGGISWIHCKISWQDGRLILVDLGSTYGTYLGDGQRLAPNVPYLLQNQTVICLGGMANQFYIKM